MARIHVLDFSIANLIAAGEVVDRPASAVKELLENAIDSGADMVTVEIKNGGTSFIRVADNGCGMDAEDLACCVRRHATSKIRSEEDLDSISTLGFRGEALAAIVAVSDLRIMSRVRGSSGGHILSCSPGKETEIAECGCAEGTTVIAERLFANVPARKKFLKKDSTEAMAVSAVVEKIAVSHPSISFKYVIDGSIRYVTSGDGILLNAIYAVMGREFASKLLPVDRDEGGVKVSGFIGRPESARANRNFENIFINGRYVRSKSIGAALEQAYTSYIMQEKFPVCVLFVGIDPRAVDVNVHPAKLEVKFSNEKLIFESVYYAVRSVLASVADRPDADLDAMASRDEKMIGIKDAFVPIRDARDEGYKPVQMTMKDVGESRTAPNDVRETVGTAAGTGDDGAFMRRNEIKTEKSNDTVNGIAESFRYDAGPEVSEQEPLPAEEPPVPGENVSADENAVSSEGEDQAAAESFRYVGVLFDCYIVAEMSDRILLIDKHAAHERILFEELKENTGKAHRSSQTMLVPVTLTLSFSEYSALEEYVQDVRATGFGIEFSDDNKVDITEIPVGIDPSAVGDMVITLAEGLSEGMSVRESRELAYEKALYQAACKAAVKGGRHDDDRILEWICGRVINDPRIRYCPHGRPVAVEVTKTSFEKQFSRIV